MVFLLLGLSRPPLQAAGLWVCCLLCTKCFPLFSSAIYFLLILPVSAQMSLPQDSLVSTPKPGKPSPYYRYLGHQEHLLGWTYDT